MSFAFAAALSVGLLVVAPILAHFLRFGALRRRPFPGARFVQGNLPTARTRRRPEDLPLLVTRALIVACLALLGATPLIASDHLNLDRPLGASIALGIVLDDSLSMRARTPGGESRFELARRAALDLVETLKSGDRVSLVLAGTPARLELGPTGDLSVARQVLVDTEVSDRDTDLDAAVHMAEATLNGAPQNDQRVALLSDMATEVLPRSSRAQWAPMTSLRHPIENCGIVQAERSLGSIRATIACTSAAAARGRRLGAKPARQKNDAARAAVPAPSLTDDPLLEQAGVQTVVLRVDSNAALDVLLSGKDDLARDDLGAVAPASVGGIVGVVCASEPEATRSGRSCPAELGLRALGHAVQPLADLPDDERTLAGLATLFVDNPAGFTPELRAALTRWLSRGGVALLMVGDHAERGQLGASLEPFVEGRVPWLDTLTPALDLPSKSDDDAARIRRPGANTNSGALALLGTEIGTLRDLGAHGRAELEGRLLRGTDVLMRWQDGAPWLVRRAVGRGFALTVGLPSSANLSDFALRPGFLALLEGVVRQSSGRLQPSHTAIGDPWNFHGLRVQIQDPLGQLIPENHRGGPDGTFSPGLAGRYTVKTAEGPSTSATEVERIVHLTAGEILTQSQMDVESAQPGQSARGPVHYDASRYAVFGLALLLGVELLLRIGRRFGTPAPG